MLIEYQFLIRGVVYQSYDRPVTANSSRTALDDDIADDRLGQLEHDVGLFKELGVNAIFVCQSARRELVSSGVLTLLQSPLTTPNAMTKP